MRKSLLILALGSENRPLSIKYLANICCVAKNYRVICGIFTLIFMYRYPV